VKDELSRDEQASLLRLARAALRQKLHADGALDRELERTELTPALCEPRGAFVSLKQPTQKGPEKLRGCIGSMSSREPLYRDVIELVKRSAFEDPRFSPMVADELAGVRIEISALTPMRAVAGHEEVVIGRHGVQLEKGPARAVFLPQVAVEHGWTLETMMRQLAIKAGLAADGWRDAKFRVFEAQVFGEPKPTG
jgi:AmmeMemoRadiSam system protein A